MVSGQLLIKEIVQRDLTTTHKPISVKFNLQRGKIARILGFSLNILDNGLGGDVNTFVRKAASPDFMALPDDLIWCSLKTQGQGGSSFAVSEPGVDYNLPKPYRCTKFSVQCAVESGAPGSDMILLCYYDIDEMEKGEATQILEFRRQRGVRTG